MIQAVIKTQFEAFHSWDNCNIKRVDFLKNKHHHIFSVEIKIPQKHDDRDVEYMDTKWLVDEFIENYLKTQNMSCEQYAKQIQNFLIKHFKINKIIVGVFEDNGCGAYVE